MSKVYEVEEVSWWDDGCDCCIGAKYTAYNCDVLINLGYGSAHSLENLYIDVLIHAGVIEGTREGAIDYVERDILTLETLLSENGIIVYII